MRLDLASLVLVMQISQVGCTAEPLPWQGSVVVSDPPGLAYPRLPALSPNGELLAVLGSSQFDHNVGYIWIWDIGKHQWLQATEDGSRPISANRLYRK